MSIHRDRRNFTNEFKAQIVQLYLNGKRKCEITGEYDLSTSVLHTSVFDFRRDIRLGMKILEESRKTADRFKRLSGTIQKSL
ncbi:transposase [Fusobacteria bacterium ZRK30]|nr:transposase [Fusobacteria bacterium ZRK30]